jgi:hypothetical protein
MTEHLSGGCLIASSALLFWSAPLEMIVKALNTNTITVPIANYDNNQHSANENIRLQNLWDGIAVMAALETME